MAGLVAITPACAFLTPLTSILLGLIAGTVCALAVGLKDKLGYHDSLDVVGVHLVGGIIGCLYLGFFSVDSINPPATKACSSAAGPRCWASRRWPRSACSPTRSPSRSYSAGPSTDDRVPDQP